MITSLSIKNYALIEDIQVDLQEGFTVITGETGAGKSIMLGALNLLLGRRADLSSIRNPEKKCIVEGVFNIAPYHLEEFFISEDLDYEDQTIIRREILSSGKSRAFINDTPVRLNSLQMLGDQLIDIHGQHETLSLGKNDYQFSVIDILAGNSAELKKYRHGLRELKKMEKDLEQLREDQAVAAREYDYNLFLLEEIRQAGLEEGMQESLEERSGELENVEQLKEQLGSALNYLGQEQIGILDSLKEAKNNLQRISGISSSYEQLYQRLQSTVIELDDIAAEVENALEKVEADPKELEEINEKLQVLYDLEKKHQTDSISGLKEIEEKLSAKVSTSENAEEEIIRMNSEISRQKKAVEATALELHKKRTKVIPPLINKTENILSGLGMPNARLKIEIRQEESFFANGKDSLSWLLSANKGGSFNPLKKAASGGELSRIMLAVKSIIAAYSKLPTIVFDEIDTGVSGDIAQKMARILKEMGETMQVIAITHLPQIAGKGGCHFRIFKEDAAGRTITNIKRLEGEARVEELAQMLGGNNLEESAVAHAKALLN